MSSYAYGRSRPNRKRRQEPQSDAVVTALAVQVVICLLLLLAAYLYKKADGDAFGRMKDQYNVMVTDQSQNEEVAELLQGAGGSLEGILSTIEEFFGGLIAQIFGVTQEEPIVVVPQEPGSETGGEGEEEAVESFNFGYLDTGNVLRTGETVLGQGGWNPVSVSSGGDTPLQAPEGSTLTPVTLGGYMQPPVTGLITSPYAYRYHPISDTSDFHTGMDIASPEGANILAALPGVVAEVGENSIYGKYIVLEHSPELQTSYSHCSEIIAGEGVQVRQGERIAKVGQTGTATGPHLHFSVLVDGLFTDPYWVLKDSIVPVEQ